jgi:hypothetical protein
MDTRSRYQGGAYDNDKGRSGARAAAAKVGKTVGKIGRAARDTGERLARDLGPVAKRVARTIGEGVGVAAAAAKTSARVVAIRAQITGAQASIAVQFRKIGELHYKSTRDPSSRSARARQIKPLVARVDQLYETIEELKAREKEARQ